MLKLSFVISLFLTLLSAINNLAYPTIIFGYVSLIIAIMIKYNKKINK